MKESMQDNNLRRIATITDAHVLLAPIQATLEDIIRECGNK